MKSWSLFVLILIACTVRSQQPVVAKPSEYSSIPPRYKLKVNLFDQSVFSMPCVKFHSEILISGSTEELPNYVSADIGYNYYSTDEDIKANGIYTGLRFNHYLNTYSRASKCLSVGVFYQRSVLRDYLKTTRTYPGLGIIQEYEKMRFQKERYGANIEILKQYPLFNNVFFEFGGSIGIISMETITPDRVTQETFVNGASYQKKALLPTVGFSLKIGYNLY